MPTRNVVLTEHQATLVDRLVKAGRYQNASEVLRDGLRMVESHEAEERARLDALREAAQIGIADVEAGRYVTFADDNELRQHLSGITNTLLEARSMEKTSR
jgi:antitoxin ParD1/3/4